MCKGGRKFGWEKLGEKPTREEKNPNGEGRTDRQIASGIKRVNGQSSRGKKTIDGQSSNWEKRIGAPRLLSIPMD